MIVSCVICLYLCIIGESDFPAEKLCGILVRNRGNMVSITEGCIYWISVEKGPKPFSTSFKTESRTRCKNTIAYNISLHNNIYHIIITTKIFCIHHNVVMLQLSCIFRSDQLISSQHDHGPVDLFCFYLFKIEIHGSLGKLAFLFCSLVIVVPVFINCSTGLLECYILKTHPKYWCI